MSSKDKKVKFKRSDLKKLFRIFRYVLPYKTQFFISFLLVALGSLTAISFPYLLKGVFEVVKGDPLGIGFFKVTNLNQLLLVLAGVMLLQVIFSYFRAVLTAYVTENSIGDIRKELYHKLITSPVTLFDKNRVGELSSRITADTTTLHGAVAFTLPQFLRQLLTIVGSIAILAVASTKLTLAMLATVPIVVLLGYVFGTFIRRLSKKRQEKLAESNVVVDETFQAFRFVKACANEQYESKRYGKSIGELIALSMKRARFQGLFFGFITIFFGAAIIFMVWRAAVMLSNGLISEGDLVMFIMYTIFIAGSIGGLPNTITALLSTIGATDRIEELLVGESEAESVEKGGIPFTFNHSIHFENVSFAYPTRPDEPVLKDISFNIKKGETVALVGPSGSGKSTIAQLLLRFYKANDGHILLDDKDINSFDLHAYRNNIGFVPQEVLLFGGTIKENIVYGKLGASEAEIKQAAKQANAWDFIHSFKEGLNTIVGERGVQLSGGQRQRVAIARALLKNPPVLILDEATSALDAESEHLVQEALEHLMKNRTTLLIAHRLSTVRNADKILVLDRGEIIEQGNHKELLEQKGFYENLIRLQVW